MSCKLISMTPIGGKYEGPREKDDVKFYPCREYITCDCPAGSSSSSFELGCHGEEGYVITRWLQDTEFCYECKSENGCIFNYCKTSTVKLGTEKEDRPCNAKDSDGCECPAMTAPGETPPFYVTSPCP